MTVIMQSGEGPANESALANAEQRLGIQFPTDYRQFQLQHGGGRPKPGAFGIQWRPEQTPAADWRRSSVAWIYFVGNDDEESVTLANLVDFRGRFPANTVAVGRDPGGNQLLIAIAGPFAGKVLFWCKDHEVGEGGVPGYDNVGIVADSFQDFLDSKLG